MEEEKNDEKNVDEEEGETIPSKKLLKKKGA